jgi:hypothetical protein
MFSGLNRDPRSPFEVLMANDRKARPPKEEIIPLRIVRFSGRSLTPALKRIR